MGREFDEHAEDVEFEGHPGCMGGIFNVLDYHHWYNVKKMLPHRNYNRGRHARCCANPQTISMEREPGETQGLLDGEVGQIQVQQQTRKTGSANKSSGKAYRKRSTSNEKPEDQNHKHWMLGFSARPQLEQTDLTNHLEPSSSGLGWMNPIILVRKRADTSVTSSTSSLQESPKKQVARSKKPEIHDTVNVKNHSKHKEHSGKHGISQKKSGIRTSAHQKPVAKKLNKEVSDKQIDGVDVLDIFNVNKDLFLDILQDPEVGIAQHFPGKQTSKTKKLTKSGSFPLSDSPRTRYLRSSTLEHKQKEVWSFRKVEGFRDGTLLSKWKALRTDDSFRSIITEEASSSSQEADPQRWNHSVMNRLKDIKQRIKHALKERRKAINQTMVGEVTLQISSRDAFSTDKRKMFQSSERMTLEQDRINNFDSSHPIDVSDHDPGNDRLNRIRRTTSINESLDRYTQLFEHNVSKEPNLHHSRSLKLTNEDKVPSRGRAPKFFRRISSLSDLESFCSLLHEVSRDAISSELPIRTVLNYDAHKESDEHNDPQSISFPEDMDKFELVEAVLEAKIQETTTEGINRNSAAGVLADRNDEEIARPCEFHEDIVELPAVKSSPHLEQESTFAVHLSRDLTRQTTDSDDIITCEADHPISKGLELNCPNHPADEAESFTILKDRCAISQENLEFAGMSRRFLFFESEKEADPCYDYVRDILELLGFIQNEYHLQTWFSADQPLNPSLFKELETLLHPQQECSIDEVGSNCDHQLIFDLVNEALVEISDKSSIYFPKPFSFNCRISPMLKANNVLQEVWTKVSRNLALQPEPDQSLDDIVARDLANDGWMNLQAEAELVALELEDLVFNELLDEVLFL